MFFFAKKNAPFLKAEWLSVIFSVGEKNKGPILKTTVYSARNVGARGFFFFRERTSVARVSCSRLLKKLRCL